MFRIRDILIRIRILGSVHWITDPVPDQYSALFGCDIQDANKKNQFFAYFLTSVFKDNMSLRIHKAVEIVVHLSFLLW